MRCSVWEVDRDDFLGMVLIPLLATAHEGEQMNPTPASWGPFRDAK
jgi:hypothetical protein